jgi:hypothetical protein
VGRGELLVQLGHGNMYMCGMCFVAACKDLHNCLCYPAEVSTWHVGEYVW